MKYALTLLVALVGTTVVGQELKPATKLSDLDWLIGKYKCEGVLAQPAIPGEPMGPPVDAKAEWEWLGEHFLVHRSYTKQNGEMSLDSVMQIGLDPKSKQLVCWGFTRNGIRADGDVLQTKNAVHLRFAGQTANGLTPKATLVIERDPDSNKHVVQYSSIEMGGKSMPVPPAVTAIPSK